MGDILTTYAGAHPDKDAVIEGDVVLSYADLERVANRMGHVLQDLGARAEDWLRLVDRHKVTTTFSAPTPVRRVVDLPKEVRDRYDYSSMQRLIANAAPWPFELKRKYVDAFGDTSLFEVYGSTELSVNTILLPDEQMRKPGSCGRACPGVEIVLFDDDGTRVTEPMQPGELYVRSKAGGAGVTGGLARASAGMPGATGDASRPLTADTLGREVGGDRRRWRPR